MFSINRRVVCPVRNDTELLNILAKNMKISTI